MINEGDDMDDDFLEEKINLSEDEDDSNVFEEATNVDYKASNLYTQDSYFTT